MMNVEKEMARYKELKTSVVAFINICESKIAEYEEKSKAAKSETEIKNIKKEMSKLKNDVFDANQKLKRYNSLIKSYKNINSKKTVKSEVEKDLAQLISEELEKTNLKLSENKDNSFVENLNKELKNKNVVKSSKKDNNGFVIKFVEPNNEDLVKSYNVYLKPIEEDYPSKRRKKINVLKKFKNWLEDKKNKKESKVKYPKGPIDFSSKELKKDEKYKPKKLVKELKKNNPFDLINDNGKLTLK